MLILKSLFTALIFLCPVAKGEAQQQPVLLKIGQMQSIPAPSGQSLKISNSQVIQVKDLGSKILVHGKKLGQSLLQVGSQEYEVQVVARKIFDLYEALKKEEKERLGLRFEVIGQEIYIQGQLHRWSDWEWLAQLANRHESSFVFKAQVDLDVQQEAQYRLDEILKGKSLSSVSWSWNPGPQASISKEIQSQKESYKKVFQDYGVEVLIQDQQIQLNPSVQVEVIIAEVVEREDQAWGMNWSSFGEFNILPTAAFGSSLSATLKLMEKKGLGKVLASPRILCRSGAEAEFHSGGEFPVPITEYQDQYKSQNVVWKKHGILLKFKPQADRFGHLSLHVLAEMSLIADQQTGEVPALLTNKIESHFDLEKPRTVALSGLIRQDWHRGQDGLPGLSQIPILGSLFKSRNFLNRKSELVVFVTPKILDEKEQPVEMPKGWNRDSL